MAYRYNYEDYLISQIDAPLSAPADRLADVDEPTVARPATCPLVQALDASSLGAILTLYQSHQWPTPTWI